MALLPNIPIPLSLDRLFDRINYERQELLPRGELKLDGIRQLALRLGNPQLVYPVIHVAGTKGKGSVTNMVGAILARGGLQVGVYTSPHLESFNQRYAINGQQISDEKLAVVLECLWPHVDACDAEAEKMNIRRLTFFDIATAAAFLYLAQEKVQAAVFEVGLGGRLDSTNICQPSVTVITTISYDHCRQLGATLGLIAGEKAGIIKPGIPVICGVEPNEPRAVIHRVAAECDAPVWQLNRDFFVEDLQVSPAGLRFSTRGMIAGCSYDLPDLFLPMMGRHQAANAGIAIAAIVAAKQAGMNCHERYSRQVLSSFHHAGRIEVVQDRPLVILDVAHNPAAVKALLDAVENQLPERCAAGRRMAIVAISRDKDQSAILERLLTCFDRIIVTRFLENPRATPIDQLLAIAIHVQAAGIDCVERNGASQAHYLGPNQGFQNDLPMNHSGEKLANPARFRPGSCEILAADTPLAAWELANALLQPNDICVVTGSVFLVSELRGKFVKPDSH